LDQDRKDVCRQELIVTTTYQQINYTTIVLTTLFYILYIILNKTCTTDIKQM